MKLSYLLACAAFVALVLPACSTAPKKQECAMGSTSSCCAAKAKGDAPGKKHKH